MTAPSDERSGCVSRPVRFLSPQAVLVPVTATSQATELTAARVGGTHALTPFPCRIWTSHHWAGMTIRPMAALAAVRALPPVLPSDRLVLMVTPEVPDVTQSISGGEEEAMAHRPLLTELAVQEATETVEASMRLLKTVRLAVADGELTEQELAWIRRDAVVVRIEAQEAQDSAKHAHDVNKFTCALQRGASKPDYIDRLSLKATGKVVDIEDYLTEPLDAA